ncbi:MAG: T9SS type A sorting domain-containing protein [Bacteroidota bacterium]|jgi:hypothetical protein
MKQIYLASLLLLAAHWGHAQTLTQAVAPSPGANYYSLSDTLQHSPGSAGPSSVWNFSNIIYPTNINTDNCVLPSATPNANAFPTATVAMGTPADTNFTYYRVTPSLSEIVGFVLGTQVIPLSNPATELTFPFSLNNTISDAYSGSFNISFGGFNVPVTVSGNANTEADASGSILLPGNISYLGVLRVHTRFTQEVSASILGSATPISSTITHTWRWFDPATRFPVFEISIDSVETFAVQLIQQPASNVVNYSSSMRTILSLSLSSTNVSCNGGSNGTATVTVNTGVPPYTYSWNTNPPQTNDTATGLTAGIYTVIVTDNAGSTFTSSVSITQPGTINVNGTVSNYSNSNTPNGGVTLNISGGTPGYQFLWSNGTTTQNLSGVMSGNYSVVVTDGNGCTASQSFTVANTTGIADVSGIAVSALYPNPADDSFVIVLEKQEAGALLELSDVSGKIIWNEQLQSAGKQSIQVSTLHVDAGMYLLRVNGKYAGKVMVHHGF